MFSIFKKSSDTTPNKRIIKSIALAAKNYAEFMFPYRDEDLIATELRELQYAFMHPPKPSTKKSDITSVETDSSEIRYSRRRPPTVSDDEYDPDEILKAFKAIKSGKFNYRSTYYLEDVLSTSFVEKMLDYIDASGEKDSDIYNRANIDRRLYSKMISDYSYTPSKDTCLMICIALKLSLEDTNDLIARCGYILSHSIKRDLVIECLISKEIYDINTINIILDSLQMKPLGRIPNEKT